MERVRKIQKTQVIEKPIILCWFFLILLSLILLNGCANTYPKIKLDRSMVPLRSIETEIPEEELLNVRIKVFNPGELPSSEDAARGISNKIREAEAHYIPVHLKNTIQQTGCWGTVSVGPEASAGDEIIVTGTILKSNGEELELEIAVRDATGKQWYKKYKGAVHVIRYAKSKENYSEAFQSLYNKISNDLIEYRKTITSKQALEIRQVAEMRFAEELAPSAFSNYLKKDKKTDLITIDRLPSENDEMLARVRRLRERDYMLTDTLDAHYENLYHDMMEVYSNWRETRLDEMNLIRKLDSKKNKKNVKGAALILAGVAAAIYGDKVTDNSTAVAITAAVAAAAGISALSRAKQITEESEINRAALEELGVSFEAEVEPFVVELEGETIELTGSAKEILHKWRQALARLYKIETGDEVLEQGAVKP